MFKNEFEALSFLLKILVQFQEDKYSSLNDEQKKILLLARNQVQVFLLNHVDDKSSILEITNKLKVIEDYDFIEIITVFEHSLKTLKVDYSDGDELFEQRLSRFFESCFAVELITKPTDGMISAVNEVSSKIIDIINQGLVSDQLMQDFLISLVFEDLISFGKTKFFSNSRRKLYERAEKDFEKTKDVGKISQDPTYEDRYYSEVLDKIVKANISFKKQNFIGSVINELKDGSIETKLWIQFKFSVECFRDLKIDEQANKLQNILEELFKSHLYTYSPHKGRDNVFNTDISSSILGICKNRSDRNALPISSSGVTWTPDCLAQKPMLDRTRMKEFSIVRDSIYNNVPYVAGPSSMFGLLYCQMLGLAKNYDDSFKINYFTSILSYIVGGGFHSFHEVLGPAESFFNLFPGYKVKNQIITEVAPPPNYITFFNKIIKVDETYKNNYLNAWKRYKEYLQKYNFNIELNESIINLDLKRTISSVIESFKANSPTVTKKSLPFHRIKFEVDSNLEEIKERIHNSQSLQETISNFSDYFKENENYEILGALINNISKKDNLRNFFNENIFKGYVVINNKTNYQSDDQVKVLEQIKEILQDNTNKSKLKKM